MATATLKSAQQNAAGFTNKQRTIALVVVALAFVMDLLDSTVVNIAIPSIQTNLGASYSTIQWLIAGYSLAFAVLLVTGGRLGDVVGYKKLFMIGVGGFTIASLLSGLAWTPEVLIGARLLQGSFAALMVPQVISLMQVMYKPEERGAINGLFGALGGLAASLGPVIGGLLIKANIFGLDWRPIFLINVPIGIIGLIAAVKYLPNGKSPHPLKLDLVGTGLLTLAMILLVFPLIQGRELDWPIWAFIMMATAIPVGVAFWQWQKRKMQIDKSPLIIPDLFKVRSFKVGLAVNLIFEAAMLGFFLTFGLLTQIGFGFTPIHAALTGLPVAVGIAFTMALAGEKLVPALGRYAMTIGTVIMAVGLLGATWTVHHYGMAVHSWQLIPGLLVVGVGMGFIFGTLFAAVLNDVDPANAGSASGVLNATQQVGGAIGIAVIGVIFFGQLTSAAHTSVRSVEPHIRTELSAQQVPASIQEPIINSLETCFVDRAQEKDTSVVPESCKQTQATGPQTPQTQQIAATLTEGAKTANATNFDHAFRAGVTYELVLLAICFGLSFLLPVHFRKEAFTEGV
jgi:EmrB/QacA subfamily drug resistance transporter